MNDEEFERIVEEGLKSVPKEFLERIENVSVVVSDWPNRNQLIKLYKRGGAGLLLGLYEGVPKIRRGSYGIGGQLPDKITIFKNPLLMISKTKSEVIANVTDTIIHEIAHHFGLSDPELDNIKKEKHTKE